MSHYPSLTRYIQTLEGTYAFELEGYPAYRHGRIYDTGDRSTYCPINVTQPRSPNDFSFTRFTLQIPNTGYHTDKTYQHRDNTTTEWITFITRITEALQDDIGETFCMHVISHAWDMSELAETGYERPVTGHYTKLIPYTKGTGHDA